ncbi:hypothetical protein SLA2020_360570 [Shorea laevis]
MDPLPLPPLPTLAASTTPTAATTATAIPAAATSMHLNYPDSVDSSPRSRTTDSYDDPLPPVLCAKLRFMCSYGGHIMPRPHDKVLCYVGGETRLVVVDRHSSFLVLCTRISRTLLHGRPFTLKYQLPNEDLDSLVTVTTDEDLENMIEEYDRITVASASSASSLRIRLFLFFNKPETVASMGALLAGPKSETWFVDALNGSMLLPRGLSDSATTDCLLNPDSDLGALVEGGAEGENKEMKNGTAAIHDVQHSMPDSPMVENASSFGSSSSTPSMANLPPIRVRIEEGGSAKMLDHRVGIEEQFAQISFASANMHKQGDGVRVAVPLPPHPATVAAAMTAAPVAMINPADGSSESMNRILSDDERPDQGVPNGFHKPPLPLQPVQHKAGGAAYNLPSPDSVASDASTSSFSKPLYHNEQAQAVSSPNNNVDASMSSSHIPIQQVQDLGHGLPLHLDQQQHQQQQQQFVHTSMHYIPQPATGTVPMPSYYPVYAPPTQQHHPHPLDQQYPVYVLPVAAQPESYMTMQSNIHDASVVALSHPLTTPNPSVVTSSAAHKDAIPPIYPTKLAPTTGKAKMAATICRVAATPPQQMVQVPSNQFQQQYVGLPQMYHPSQSIAVAPATAANYGYEYANSTHDQMYYTQHQATPLPPHYQTMTQAAAAAALADPSKQMPADNTKKQ